MGEEVHDLVVVISDLFSKRRWVFSPPVVSPTVAMESHLRFHSRPAENEGKRSTRNLASMHSRHWAWFGCSEMTAADELFCYIRQIVKSHARIDIQATTETEMVTFL